MTKMKGIVLNKELDLVMTNKRGIVLFKELYIYIVTNKRGSRKN